MNGKRAPASGDPRRPSALRTRPWKLGEAARRRLLASVASRAGTGARSGESNTVDVDAAIANAIREETAAAIGRAGRRLQAAVAALAEYEVGVALRAGVTGGNAAAVGDDDRRARLLDDATDALWACVVQREAMGLTDHRMLDGLYRVPPLLWRRLGATTSGTGSIENDS